eukprot:gene11493-13586_t
MSSAVSRGVRPSAAVKSSSTGVLAVNAGAFRCVPAAAECRYRGFAMGSERLECPLVAKTLEAVGARQMVIGHTVQDHGVGVRCDGTLHLIDVGISRAYGGEIAAWECTVGAAGPMALYHNSAVAVRMTNTEALGIIIAAIGDAALANLNEQVMQLVAPARAGDLLDRGPNSLELLDLFARLKDEAENVGGTVTCLLGNHELMTLQGDLRYVSRTELKALAAKTLPAAAGDTEQAGNLANGRQEWSRLFQPGQIHGHRLRSDRQVALPLHWVSAGELHGHTWGRTCR